jgi:outer membrane protein, multidrug efflux system
MQLRSILNTAIPAVALAAAGCAPALNLRAPSTPLPNAFEAGELASSDVAVLDRWWTIFADPQLDALVTSALANATDARLALARLDEARAVRQAALARFGVQGDLQVVGGVQRSETLKGPDQLLIGGGVGGGANVSGATVVSIAPSFNLSWELDLLGRRGTALRAADADFAAARFAQEGARATLAAEVADALFAARGLAAQLDDAQTTLRIQRDVLRIIRVRADRGLAPAADVSRIDADVAQAEAQAQALTAELTATRRAILVLIGKAELPLETLKIEAQLDAAPRPPATVPGELLTRRPDVREAEQRLRSAIARAELQRLELFPRLTLNPGTGLTAVRTAGVDAITATWTLGAGLALPILDRPRLLAETRAESARAEQAAIGYERAVQTAFSEADQALVRFAADRERVALLARGERQSTEAYRAARLLFGRGLNDLPALLDAERTQRGARAAAASARTDALRRAVTVFRALGGGWDAAATRVAEPKG